MADRVILSGGFGGARTHDKWLKRPLLYQLSYEPIVGIGKLLKHFNVFQGFFQVATQELKNH